MTSVLSRPPCAAGGILVNEIAGPAGVVCERQPPNRETRNTTRVAAQTELVFATGSNLMRRRPPARLCKPARQRYWGLSNLLPISRRIFPKVSQPRFRSLIYLAS